jgi:hypothetical protein
MASAGIWASSFHRLFPHFFFFFFFFFFFDRLVKKKGVMFNRFEAHRDAPVTVKGRNKRKSDAYVVWSVEGLSEARTLR